LPNSLDETPPLSRLISEDGHSTQKVEEEIIPEPDVEQPQLAVMSPLWPQDNLKITENNAKAMSDVYEFNEVDDVFGV
jgi:hypothetical protein